MRDWQGPAGPIPGFSVAIRANKNIQSVFIPTDAIDYMTDGIYESCDSKLV